MESEVCLVRKCIAHYISNTSQGRLQTRAVEVGLGFRPAVADIDNRDIDVGDAFSLP